MRKPFSRVYRHIRRVSLKKLSVYTAIIGSVPTHSDANHNLGVLAVGVGKVDIALPYFKTALEASPNHGQYWISYIDALIKLGRIILVQ